MTYYIGYEADTYKDMNNKVKKFVVKAKAQTKEAADKINRELSDKLNKFEFNQDKMFRRPGDKPSTALRYVILTDAQMQERLNARKQESSKKRAATLAKKTPEQKKKTYILCPHCHAHSKLLYTEMGGYQTRKCKNEHTFNHDKWIGDRLLSIAVFGAGPVAVAKWAVENPIEVK